MMKPHLPAAIVPALLYAVLASAVARADTDPRDYALVLAPDHTNVFLAYARHQTSADSENIVQNVTLYRYLHLLKFGDLAVVPVDLVLPVADAQLYLPSPGGGTTTLHGSGMGDLVFLPHVGYAIKESEEDATYFAFSQYVHAPTGNYDDKKVINIGQHRWQFDEELCIGQRFLGALFVEAVGAATFYTKNDDFVPPGTTTPLRLGHAATFSATVHASANVGKSVWLGASYLATANGKETIATPGGDQQVLPAQTIQSVRATFGVRPAEPFLLLFQYQTDIAASGGGTIGRFVGARASYLF